MKYVVLAIDRDTDEGAYQMIEKLVAHERLHSFLILGHDPSKDGFRNDVIQDMKDLEWLVYLQEVNNPSTAEGKENLEKIKKIKSHVGTLIVAYEKRIRGGE